MSKKNLINLSAIAEAAFMAAQSQSNRPRFEPLPEGVFPAPSLTQWMALATAAGIPVVPAEEVGRVRIEDVLNFEEPDRPGVRQALEKLDALNQALDERHMLRWDCCAGMGIKAFLSDGDEPPTHARGLYPDDPRAFDILFTYPADEIALIRRPWLEPLVIDGFPLEFRVFIAQGQPVAVASYYPQRDVPDTPQVRAFAAQSLDLARAVLAELNRSGLSPAVPGQPDPQSTCATLDFFVDDQQQVRFLEAGPGFGYGAHPCAFLNPDNRTVAPVVGLCLAQGGPSIPLAELAASVTSTVRPSRP